MILENAVMHKEKRVCHNINIEWASWIDPKPTPLFSDWGIFYGTSSHVFFSLQAMEMIRDIREAFNELLDENVWMDEATKSVAREKVTAVYSRIEIKYICMISYIQTYAYTIQTHKHIYV